MNQEQQRNTIISLENSDGRTWWFNKKYNTKDLSMSYTSGLWLEPCLKSQDVCHANVAKVNSDLLVSKWDFGAWECGHEAS
jgi:hypothetical protein